MYRYVRIWLCSLNKLIATREREREKIIIDTWMTLLKAEVLSRIMPVTVDPITPQISMISPIMATPDAWNPNGENNGLIVFPSERRRPIIRENESVRVRKFLSLLISLNATTGLFTVIGIRAILDGGFSGCSLNITWKKRKAKVTIIVCIMSTVCKLSKNEVSLEEKMIADMPKESKLPIKCDAERSPIANYLSESGNHLFEI